MERGSEICFAHEYGRYCGLYFCIGLAWWALQAFRFDVLLKRPKAAQAIMLQILLSIALGHLVASFIIQYLGLSMGFGKMF
ncbi:DUF1146 domain-containing protein [Paenibacillus sp. N3.4]|nr:DUF1146 domain-containing protein [Paenibacillus sp. N3.4]